MAEEVKTLVLGAVTNYNYEQIAPWINSLRQTGYDGQIGLIVYSLNAETVERLKQEKINLYAFGFDPQGNSVYNGVPGSIMVDRFIHAAVFFRGMENIDQVIMTDVRDVIFQSDPSKLEGLKTKDIVIATESLKFMHEPWNINNMLQSFGPYFFKNLENQPIVCAGVIAGKKDALIDLFEQIYLFCRGCPAYVPGGGGADQAALNILINSRHYSDNTYKSLEILHAGTTLPALRSGKGDAGLNYVNNEQIRNIIDQSLLGRTPYMMDGIIHSGETGKPYCIVHQYNRVDEWNEVLGKKYV